MGGLEAVWDTFVANDTMFKGRIPYLSALMEARTVSMAIVYLNLTALID